MNAALALAALGASAYALTAFDGWRAWSAAIAGLVLVVLFGQRAMWSRHQWRRYVAFRRGVDLEALEANEGQYWRPPMW